jgi:hypothetical protein
MGFAQIPWGFASKNAPPQQFFVSALGPKGSARGQMAGMGAGGPGHAGNRDETFPLLLPILVSIIALVNARKTLAVVLGSMEEVEPKRVRVARTRCTSGSSWGTLYSLMSPKEFRETFRIPRVLFDEIITTLRPELQSAYV